MATVQLAAVLFCDVVGSTSVLVDRGDAHFDDLRRRLEAIVGGAVAVQGGRVVKGLGDGAMAAFDTPSDAIAAAVAVMQATHRARDLPVRVGVSAGEVSIDEGDLFGTTVVEAARLCTAAAPGQILVSSTAALLARRGSTPLSPVGPLSLKGFPEPVDAFEAQWSAPPTDTPAPAAIPPALQVRSAFAFVARPAEWDALASAWAAVRDGGRHLALVGGEPGAGKTRLVSEFARHTAGEGAIVLFGACHEEGGPPFEAFAEALGGAALTPELAGPTPDPVEDRRDALFQSIADRLASMGETAPVLLVVDDLHWARRPTLQLLLHLLRSPAALRLCVVATHRDSPDDLSDAFAAVLPEIHRIEGITRIAVGGLDRRGVGAFVETASGSALDAVLQRVVEMLWHQTDGNPFLLGEMWRHLVESGALERDERGRWRTPRETASLGAPDTVRSVVGRRIDRLPREARAALEAAAIIGSPFALDVLADTLNTARIAVLDHLEPALAGATIVDAGSGRFAFSHALVSRAIHDRLSIARRAQLHLDVARAIEQKGVTDATLPDLARHYLAAVPLADIDAAVSTAIRAADAAMRSLAYEDAGELLATAIALAEDVQMRAELLLRLADAISSAGDTATAMQHAREAAEIARTHGRHDLLCAAALAFEEASWLLGLPGGDAERLLREALPYAPDEPTRIHVLAARGRALALSGEPGADNVIEEAIAAAREMGDVDVLMFALHAWFNVPWQPEHYPRMLERARELRTLAIRAGNQFWEMGALQWLLQSMLLTGDFSQLRATNAELERVCERSKMPFHRHLVAVGNSTIALMDGRFDEAEAFALRGAELSELISGSDASGVLGVQMFSLRREQGRLEEVRPVVEAVVRLDRAHAAWRPGLAAVYAELGMLDEARAEVRHLVEPGLWRIPRDSLYIGSLTYLADAVAAVGDRSAAATVHAALEPYQGTVAVVGHNIACYGAVDRYLGMLAETAGRGRDAERHYVRALEIDTRCGSPVWVAHSRYRYARFIARQGRRDGPRRARELAAQALAIARQLGMATLERRAAELVDELHVPVESETASAPGGSVAVDLTPREREILACLVDGLSNAQIGKALHVSPNTAANHVRSILMKTGCANRTEAAAWAVRNGVVVA